MTAGNYYVYIMTTEEERLLYIGVTDKLRQRLKEHKAGLYRGFSADYRLNKLLYYEIWDNVEAAVKRRQQLKSWHRQWKFNLIAELNPELNDLSAEV